ncbi:T9SS type A sorting domain-containing protein [Flavobacterium alkalisoli]|uniref:T9SS type A sorting domain-containing protein n=2 Tax=Flavobacterium alkalisoli TaxID=2602769 RepID=A0A5B9FV80_9FLAO|nr:T9SS type A sorting domain-containing protein [Flavobacterium alkalisoli]
MNRITFRVNFRPYLGNLTENRVARFLLFFVMCLSFTVVNAQTVTIGSGTTTSVSSTTGSGLGPVNGYYEYMRYQVVYTAAEITSAGGAEGLITEMGWNLATLPNAGTLPNYKIRFALTDATDSASNNTASLTEVYSGDYTPALGFDMIDLSTPFLWDGTSNILVDVCYGSVPYTSSFGTVYTYGTADNSSRFARSDVSSRCGVATDIANNFKPQIQFTMSPPPSCFPVSGLSVSGITNSSAVISWNALTTAPADGYDYYVSESSTAPTAATDPTDNTDETSATLTLDPTTQYYVWVRSDCGDETSDWSTVLTFTTFQVPATMPFSEDFETSPNWNIANGSQVNKWFIGTAVNNGGTSSLYISNDNGTTNDYNNGSTSVVHAYRDITLPEDIVQAMVSFDWKGTGEDGYDYLSVWVVPATYVPVAGQEIEDTDGLLVVEELSLSGDAFLTEQYVIDAADYAGETVRLVFEWINDDGVGSSPAAAVDNISVTEVTCFAPEEASHLVTYEGVTLSWTALETAPTGGYDYYYSTENTAPTEETIPTGNTEEITLSLTTLDADTVYYYWVRSNCSGTYSEWVSGGSFRTECDAVTPVVTQDFTDYTGSIPGDCWKEQTGVLGTAVVLQNEGSSWQSGNFNNDSGNANGKAAYINLYDGLDDWFVSPAIDLGDGSVTYQLSVDALVIPWSGSTPIADMEDKFVKIVVSTDAGNTWDVTNVIKTYGGDNIPSGGVSDIISLEGYTGIIKIGFYAHSEDDTPDSRFYIDNFVVDVQPDCALPIDLVYSDVAQNSVQVSWTAPATAPANGYEYYVNEDGTVPTPATEATGSVEAGVLTAEVTDLTSGTRNYVWVRSNCSEDAQSEWVGPVSFMTACTPSDLTVTEPGEVCGEGTTELEASSTTGTVYWFESADAALPVGEGDTFEIPYITETTSFYVSSAQTSVGALVKVGQGAATTNTYSNPLYSAWSNNHTQHLITAAELTAAGLSAGDINSIALDVTSAGTLPMKDLTIKIGTSSAANMEAFVANDAFSIVYSNVSYLPAEGVNTFNFETPFNWDGTSNIVVEFCHGNSSSSATMSRTVKSDATAYVSTIKHHFSESTSGADACAATEGGTVVTYSVRPQFIFNGNGLCFSSREEVEVVVTDAPDITPAATEEVICIGGSTDLSVTSDNADYTYVWTPGDLEGALQTVSPTETTIYTVTATDEVSGCIETATITVTVNLLPGEITIAEEPIEVCGNTLQLLTAQGANVSGEVVIGNGTTAPSTTSYPNPLSAYYGGVKTQILYTEQELLAQGLVIGAQISSLAFDFNASAANACNDLTIRMGSTTNTNMEGGFVTSAALQTVYNQNFTPVSGTTGYVDFNFSTSYTWTGGNLIVEVVHNQGNNGNGSGTRTNTTTTGFASVYYGAKDGVTPAGVASFDAVTSYGTSNSSTSRPNISFNYSVVNAVTWVPATNLYTDAEGIVAYTEGDDVDMVYFMSNEAGEFAYTATATNAAGCSVTADVTVNVNITEVPVADAEQIFCGASIVADLTADGNDIQWYADETADEVLTEETAIETGTYFVSQMIDGCESARVAVEVTVNITPAPEGESVQEIGVYAGQTADISLIEVTGVEGGVITWYLTEEDALNNENPLGDDYVIENEATYYAVQTIDGCPSEPFAVTVSVVLDTKDFDSANFAYWPNPVKDVLTVSYSSAITSATVYNMLGQPVISQQINALEGTVNMANLSEGTYIVIVATETATKTIRVVKKQ